MEIASEHIKKYFNHLTEKQLAQFDALHKLYNEWNEKINVISRKDMDSFVVNHVMHSLSIAAIHEFRNGEKIMDLGCGGGFPGLPLAIFFPDTDFVLVDSINKKLKVIEDIALQLGITNISVKHSRAEEMPQQSFHMIISRAVAPLGTLIHWSKKLIIKKKDPNNLPFRNPGLICLKGGDLGQEISESRVKPLVWQVDNIMPYEHFKEKYILYVGY